MQLNQIPKMISYKERVYDELKQAIIKNELKSGEILNERHLAVTLGISRTPVREALQWLEREGWVETEPCKGAWVRRFTDQDIADIYQIRRVMEPLAIALAVPRMGAAEDRHLSELLERQKCATKVVDHKTFTDMDLEFHLYFAKISGNRLLYESLSALMERMSMYLIHTIRRTQPYSVPIAEHMKILNAVLQRDTTAGQSAIVEHIDRAYVTAVENLGLLE